MKFGMVYSSFKTTQPTAGYKETSRGEPGVHNTLTMISSQLGCTINPRYPDDAFMEMYKHQNNASQVCS